MILEHKKSNNIPVALWIYIDYFAALRYDILAVGNNFSFVIQYEL